MKLPFENSLKFSNYNGWYSPPKEENKLQYWIVLKGRNIVSCMIRLLQLHSKNYLVEMQRPKLSTHKTIRTDYKFVHPYPPYWRLKLQRTIMFKNYNHKDICLHTKCFLITTHKIIFEKSNLFDDFKDSLSLFLLAFQLVLNLNALVLSFFSILFMPNAITNCT